LVIFRSQYRSASKKVGKHWHRPSESFSIYRVLLVYLLKAGLEILETCYTTGMYKLQLPVFVENITLFFHDTITRNTVATYSNNRLMIVVMN